MVYFIDIKIWLRPIKSYVCVALSHFQDLILANISSFKQEPKTQGQFEQSHRRIENVVVHDLVEVGENEIDNGAEHAPRRGDHSEKS